MKVHSLNITVRRREVKVHSLNITVADAHRGNRHGYTSSDYARDAAAEIERGLADAGLRSWPANGPEAEIAEASARREAEKQIAECDEIFRDLLGIEVTAANVE